MDYRNPEVLKRALKNFKLIEASASFTGNDNLVSLLVDIKKSLNESSGALTPKQYQAIDLVLVQGLTEAEAGERLGISQQAVFYRILYGLRRMSKFLENKLRTIPKGVQDKMIRYYEEGLTYEEIGKILGLDRMVVKRKLKYLRSKGVVKLRGS